MRLPCRHPGLRTSSLMLGSCHSLIIAPETLCLVPVSCFLPAGFVLAFNNDQIMFTLYSSSRTQKAIHQQVSHMGRHCSRR